MLLTSSRLPHRCRIVWRREHQVKMVPSLRNDDRLHIAQQLKVASCKVDQCVQTMRRQSGDVRIRTNGRTSETIPQHCGDNRHIKSAAQKMCFLKLDLRVTNHSNMSGAAVSEPDRTHLHRVRQILQHTSTVPWVIQPVAEDNVAEGLKLTPAPDDSGPGFPGLHAPRFSASFTGSCLIPGCRPEHVVLAAPSHGHEHFGAVLVVPEISIVFGFLVDAGPRIKTGLVACMHHRDATSHCCTPVIETFLRPRSFSDSIYSSSKLLDRLAYAPV
jgi:hypothetical protein